MVTYRLYIQYQPSSFENVAKLISLFVGMVGVTAILLLWKQIASSQAEFVRKASWERTMSYHTLYSDMPSGDMIEGVQSALKVVDFVGKPTIANPIQPELAKKLVKDVEQRSKVARYLDCFEELCAAIHKGIIDNTYVYEIEGQRVINVYFGFREYIRLLRRESDDWEIAAKPYHELRCIAHMWYATRKQEKEDNIRNHVRSRIDADLNVT